MTGPAPTDSTDVFAAGGDVGRDLRAVDWSATPLGAPDAWSRSLATVVRMMLASRFAMWMAWGPELTFFCNDAYRRDTLGKKYPWALGRPASEVWAEIWPEIGPRIEAVMSTGEATWDEALQLFLERSGYPEETYHTFSYSPLADDEGRIMGMLCVVSEDTDRVIGERRMATLRDLGSVPSSGLDEHEFLRAASVQLAGNPSSMPFTIIYLFGEHGEARLAGSSGVPRGHAIAPRRIPAGAQTPWPTASAASGHAVVVADLTERFGDVPTGPWELPPEQAIVVPLAQPGHDRPYGFLVVGANRYRPVDADYRAVVELIAQRLAAGITASRSYEAERRRSEQLMELDRAKTVFFSNVSHEFRTPLTLMLGPLEDALTGAGTLDAGQLELVHRNALRLLKLVNALLDFSRAEAGRVRAEFRPLDLGAFTAELAGTFRDATNRAGIDLEITYDELPGPVYVDRDLWERIVLNLISNAFKVTLDGGISVHVAAVDGAAQLTVTDTGPGIPSDELDRLFQRFHRLRSTTARSYEGTGIGLALVKELTELHGGEVSVASTVGVGTTFTVRLPLGSEHLPVEHVLDDEAAPAGTVAPLFVEEALSWVGAAPSDLHWLSSAEEPPLPGGATHAEVRRQVLIADDNPDLRRYLTRLLSTHFDVETVADGEAALRRIGERPPDLLISDVMMPGLDGYELLAALRAEPETRELPVIVLSARAGEEAAIEGLGAGADDYLPKPFSGRELLARVRSHLELAAVRRQASAEVRAERLRLEQTLQQLPAGVILAEGPATQVVMANELAEDILGAIPQDPLPTERWPLARAIRDDEVIQDEDIVYVTGTGRRLILRVSAAPIHDDRGETIAGVMVFQDVSERVRSERMLTAQRDILAMVASGEPLERTLEAIAGCAQSLSEYDDARVSIMLLSPDRRRLEHGAAPSLPDAYNEAIDGIAVGPSVGSSGTAAYRGETVIVSDIATDPLWIDYRALAAEHGLRASWSTPIRATNGLLVGTFAVYYDHPRSPSREDRRTVELLTRTAGVAIGRSRDMLARARQLNELQRSLLPRRLPEIPGMSVGVSFRPGDRGLDVGGDFYDVFSLPGGGWGFVVGDVRGHGAEAAAVTALTRHTTRAIARLDLDPGRVLEVVNNALRHSDFDRFCTAVYGHIALGPDGATVRLANAGHPPPLLRRASGAVTELIDHGPLLGVFPEPRFPEISCTLDPGDTLVLYTDGLIERNPRVRDDAGLRSLVAALPGGDAAEQLAALERQAFGDPPGQLGDDVAVLTLQVDGSGR